MQRRMIVMLTQNGILLDIQILVDIGFVNEQYIVIRCQNQRSQGLITRSS